MERKELVKLLVEEFLEVNDIFSVVPLPNGPCEVLAENYEELVEDFMSELQEEVKKEVTNF